MKTNLKDLGYLKVVIGEILFISLKVLDTKVCVHTLLVKAFWTALFFWILLQMLQWKQGARRWRGSTDWKSRWFDWRYLNHGHYTQKPWSRKLPTHSNRTANLNQGHSHFLWRPSVQRKTIPQCEWLLVLQRVLDIYQVQDVFSCSHWINHQN